MLKTVRWFFVLGTRVLVFASYLPHVSSLTEKGKLHERDLYVEKKTLKLAKRMERVAGVTYDIAGRENIPAKGAVIYIGNHQGLFDAPLMLSVPREPSGFILKKELGRVPLAGTWLKYLYCVFVDRKNKVQAATTVEKCVDNVRAGHSMVIFPEGTRSKNGQIGQFKTGAFRIAMQTGAPLVPVVIDGSRNVWDDKKRIRSGKIYCRVLKPVYVPEMQRAEFREYIEKVRGMMIQELEKLREEENQPRS